MGIFSAGLLGDIEALGFDFAITATFIAMVVPMIKNKSVLLAVVISGLLAVALAWFEIEQSLMIATLTGMAIGAMVSQRSGTALTIEQKYSKEETP